MSVAEFKRWHWALIGLALGLIVSLWRGWVGPEAALIDRPTLEAADFEKLILQKNAAGQPMVRDIRVHSVVDGTYWLTAQQVLRDDTIRNNRRERYVPVKIPARTPFVPQTTPPSGAGKVDPHFTVVDWLKSMKTKHPEIGFSTRWWAQEPARTPLFALCGMLALAGFCPRLVHAWYGTTPAEAKRAEEAKKKAEEYDLSRFGKGKPEPAAKAKHAITEEDLKHVRELDEELERRLATGAAGGGSGGDASQVPAGSSAAPGAATPQSDQPIRKLQSGPLETTIDEHPKKQKRFDGEFYPTETHVKQDDGGDVK